MPTGVDIKRAGEKERKREEEEEEEEEERERENQSLTHSLGYFFLEVLLLLFPCSNPCFVLQFHICY